MNKYNFDKQLKIKVKPFFSKRFLPLANAVISVLPKKLNKKRIVFKKYDINGLRLKTLTPKNQVKPDSALPCLIYLHGGGFGYKESFVQYRCEQEYALTCGCAVISVDYPLLPKADYKTVIEYAVKAYKFITENPDKFNINAEKIALAGDSAGGLIATELAFKSAEQDFVKPVALMLVYPVVDGENRDSMKKYTDVPMWNSVSNEKMREYFLRGETFVSPVNRDNKPHINNLFVEIEEFDCLRDEGLALFDSLKPYSEKAVLLYNKGTFHGFDINFKADITKSSLQKRTEFLAEAFNK